MEKRRKIEQDYAYAAYPTMARFDCRVAKLTILRISKIRKLLDEGGIMEVGIDKDLIGNPGGRKRVERDNRSRKTKRRVRKANSVFGAGCNERGTDRRNVPRVIDTACIFTRCIVLESGNGSSRSHPRNFQFAPLCIRPADVSARAK